MISTIRIKGREKMKLKVFLVAVLFLVISGGVARAEFSLERAGMNYLHRQSAALDNHYLQYFCTVNFNKYLNPSVGVEHDQTEGQIRRYFVENTFQLTQEHAAVLRYNRVEYPDWDIMENILNMYYLNTKKHFRGAAGISYHMVDMFGDTMDQLRLNFELSYGIGWAQDKFGFRAGVDNFNQFENFASMMAPNEIGPFIDIYTRIRKHFYLDFYYEPRLIGLTGGHPILGRETWMMGLSWKD
jgi:hypothetical protein